MTLLQWRTQEKISGGSRLWPASLGVRRRRPQDAGEFWKSCTKICLLQLQKMHNFRIIFEKFKKPCITFWRVWRKNTNCLEILRKSWKFSKNLFRKFRKSFILTYFSKDLTNHALSFRAFGRKNKL